MCEQYRVAVVCATRLYGFMTGKMDKIINFIRDTNVEILCLMKNKRGKRREQGICGGGRECGSSAVLGVVCLS